MARIFVYSLVTIVLGLFATVFLAREPGYLLVSFAGVTFETSLFALLIAALAVFLVVRIVLLLLAWINPLRLFRAGRAWSESRAEKKALHRPLTTEQMQRALHRELLQELAKEESALSERQLCRLWKTRTKKMPTSAELVLAYISVLEKLEARDEAVRVLELEIENTWSDALLRHYSLITLRVDDAAAIRQVQQAEQWLQNRPSDAALLLALGRLSLRNELWDKAREYLERSLQTQANLEAFAELARLLLNLKEPEHSAQYLQNETRLISAGLPDFPQPV